MRNVLFVTYHYLHGSGGGTNATRGYINAFSALSEKITLLCPVQEGLAPEKIDPKVTVIPVADNAPKWKKFLHLLCGRLHRYMKVFGKVLSSESFDTVVFDTCYSSFRLVKAARQAGARVITIHHNFQLQFVKDNYRFPLLQPLRFWTKRAERDALLLSDVNFVLTEDDKRQLQRYYDPGEQAVVKVFGVNEYAHAEVIPAPARVDMPVFIITGNLQMPQTEIPLMEWVERYYPILREEVPDADVIVAGRNPSDALTQKCLDAGMEIIPSPANMQTVLVLGRYYICPTDMGSGLKLRSMDGLKNGMPVLSHQAAARGYEPLIGKSVFVYHDAPSFRVALKAMMASPLQREEICAMYRDVFSLEAGIDRLRSLL